MSSCSVELDGLVISKPIVKVSYGIENIYEVTVQYKRLSGKYDKFLVYYSDGLNLAIEEGQYIRVFGDLRSTIIKDDLVIFPKVYVMSKEIVILESEPEQYENKVEILEGEITRETKLRKSYNDDNVDIAEIGVKLVRHNNKTSKIMCTSWNNNARLVSKYHIKDKITAEGRLQSHETKRGHLLVQVALSAIEITETPKEESNKEENNKEESN